MNQILIMKFFCVNLLFFLKMAVSSTIYNEYALPAKNSRLVGQNIIVTVPNDGKPLESIASHYKIGLLAMLEANPGVDPLLPTAGTQLVIPTQLILPDEPRTGIVVNLAELRLFYYPANQNKVIVYPIGIGQLGRSTPTMATTITQKIKNPSWTPTENIRRIYALEGTILPKTVPPGPDNPMGAYALRLAIGRGEYLIHGTNADFGIGMRVSSGCIRLRPDDIEALFDHVPIGTPVKVINEAVKVTVEPDGSHYIEVHQPLSKKESDDPQTMPIPLSGVVSSFIANSKINYHIVDQALQRRSGLPILVNSNE